MNFQELIDAYTGRLDVYLNEIDRICQLPNRKRKIEMPTSPNYLEEVLIPVYESLREYLRRKQGRGSKIGVLAAPDPTAYRPVNEYYRIKVGLQTVGGFSVPDGNDFSIYFTPLKSAVPIGERLKVENEEQLGELILKHLKNHKEL